jgi:hypothetical protein
MIFDHVGVVRLPKTLSKCKELGIPTISLPHGMNIYTDDFDTVKRVRKFHGFDYLTTTEALGSARYCSEWMDINESIYPRSGMPDGRLKVGFSQGKTLSAETKYILDNLSNDLPHIQFYVQQDMRKSDVPPFPFTSEVISWADVMLETTSCTITEHFIKNKPTLHLRYCHSRGVNFEGRCYNVHDYENLLSSLQWSLSPKDARGWLNYHVYCNKGFDYDVLGAYVNYITEK